MGKFKHRPGQITGKFVALPYNLLESEAYVTLSHAARTLYTLLLKAKTHAKQGEVTLPYRTIQPYIKNFSTIRNAIWQLENRGFVTRGQYGGLYRRSNVYRFSDDWRWFKYDDKAKAQERAWRARHKKRKIGKGGQAPGLVNLNRLTKVTTSNPPKTGQTAYETVNIDRIEQQKQLTKVLA